MLVIVALCGCPKRVQLSSASCDLNCKWGSERGHPADYGLPGEFFEGTAELAVICRRGQVRSRGRANRARSRTATAGIWHPEQSLEIGMLAVP